MLVSECDIDFDRDAYGFAVRPQHLQRYREYANIYEVFAIWVCSFWNTLLGTKERNKGISFVSWLQEEEEERSEKWRSFLDQQSQSVQLCSSEEESNNRLSAEITEQKAEPGPQLSGGREPAFDIQTESDPKKDVQVATKTKNCEVQTWAEIRPSLHAIELMMSSRGKKRKNMKDEHITTSQNHLPSIEEARTSRQESEENFEDEFYDNEIVDDSVNTPAEGTAANDGVSLEPFFPWKQELEFLVHGGVPRELRGEVWQAFVGVRTCRVEGYYQNLLAAENDSNDMREDDKSCNSNKGPNGERVGVPQKLRRQIEKDLPRTFPGHPALDEDGKNSLRRLLLAYARHNPSVGYCQDSEVLVKDEEIKEGWKNYFEKLNEEYGGRSKGEKVASNELLCWLITADDA
ncbi:hypothetical protein CsSME_00038509 [Camellia sinensis var. sinensis]